MIPVVRADSIYPTEERLTKGLERWLRVANQIARHEEDNPIDVARGGIRMFAHPPMLTVVVDGPVEGHERVVLQEQMLSKESNGSGGRPLCVKGSGQDDGGGDGNGPGHDGGGHQTERRDPADL